MISCFLCDDDDDEHWAKYLAQKIQVAVSCHTLFAMYLVEVVVLTYACLAAFLNNKLC